MHLQLEVGKKKKKERVNLQTNLTQTENMYIYNYLQVGLENFKTKPN